MRIASRGPSAPGGEPLELHQGLLGGGEAALQSAVVLPFRRRPLYTFRMAEPVRRRSPLQDPPSMDPLRIEQAYRLHRRRREERLARRRSRRYAQIRFWLVLVALLALTIFFSVTIWHQVQRLFGL